MLKNTSSVRIWKTLRQYESEKRFVSPNLKNMSSVRIVNTHSQSELKNKTKQKENKGKPE